MVSKIIDVGSSPTRFVSCSHTIEYKELFISLGIVSDLYRDSWLSPIDCFQNNLTDIIINISSGYDNIHFKLKVKIGDFMLCENCNNEQKDEIKKVIKEVVPTFREPKGNIA